MNRWSEQLKNHPVHEAINQLEVWVSTEFDDISEEELSERNRFMKVIGLHKEVLQDIDADIIPFNQLDGLNKQLRTAQIWNQAHSYSENNNIAHLKAANDHLSTLLTQLCLLIPLVENERDSSKRDDTESFEYGFRALIKKKEALEQELTKLKVDIEKYGSDVADLTSITEERKKETDAALSQWQQQFSDAQDKRSDNFNDWKNGIEKETKKTTTTIISNTDKEVATFKEKIEVTLDQLESDSNTKHKAILELYELASGDSISGGYAQTANKERSQSNFWRFISYVFIIAAVVWLYTAYQQSGITLVNQPSEVINQPAQEMFDLKDTSKVENRGAIEEVTRDKVVNNITEEKNSEKSSTSRYLWQHILLSFSLTGVLLFGAGYAARQAHSHRSTEQKTRWFALQVKALDPYISSMSPDDQRDLKKQLADKFFNGIENSSVDDKSSLDTDSPSSIIKSITDLVKQVK